MSLSITFNTGASTEWHVGEENPIGYHEVPNVREIQADGHELEHIENMFTKGGSLPKGRVIRIFGDLARTIVGNLTNIQ